MKVFKQTTREYYTQTLSRPNRWGSTETARSRLVTSWTALLDDGRRLEGYDRKRDAVEAARRAAP